MLKSVIQVIRFIALDFWKIQLKKIQFDELDF
jgi:hypothetical protein